MKTNIRGEEFIINTNISMWVWPGLESWDKYTLNWIEKNRGLDTLWDIGAWIGPFTLYAARLYKNVIAFEPDWVAFKALEQHIIDNSLTNVTTIKLGMYNEETQVNFGFIGEKYGDSLSSINHPAPLGTKIKTTTIDAALLKYKRPDFIKIDIEGSEEYLIDDLVKHKFNRMCMSNHGPYMKDRKRFEKILNEQLLPLYNCYSIKDEKVDFIPDDGDFYYELKV